MKTIQTNSNVVSVHAQHTMNNGMNRDIDFIVIHLSPNFLLKISFNGPFSKRSIASAVCGGSRIFAVGSPKTT